VDVNVTGVIVVQGICRLMMLISDAAAAAASIEPCCLLNLAPQ